VPVDRTLGEDLATNLVQLYTDAQTRLAANLAQQLAADIGTPDWAERKLAQLIKLRGFAESLLRQLDGEMGAAVEQAIVLAYHRGGQAALAELAKLGGANLDDLVLMPGTEAVQRLVYSLSSTLRGTHLRILRWDLDTYREVIAKVGVPDVLMGTKTRLRAAQVAWEELLGQGITGFVDKSGRRWELASYVEMATRTGTAQAAVEAHLDRLADAGIDLVIVSNAPQECKRCRPWEGKVLARNGGGGRQTLDLQHATEDGQTVTVHVAGTVDQAVADGLMHPNCRHSLSAYLPGVTKAPTNTEDPDGDEARQKLRALERDVRAAKMQAATAMTPEAKSAYQADVRDGQAAIRDHIATAPADLFRQSHREQIGQAR
jgi:hypothetical protein